MCAILKVKGNTAGTNYDLLSFEEYELIAKKTLNYLLKCNKIGKKTHYVMMNSEENFSYIVHALMEADWKFNPEKSGRETWRMNYVIWEIGRITTNYCKSSNFNTTTFSELSGENSDISNTLEKAKGSENRDEIYNLVITEAQAILPPKSLPIFMLYYYSNWTVSKIARKYAKSHSTINNVIKKCIIQLSKSEKIGRAVNIPQHN